jgi:Arabinose efflux permease
MDEKPTLNRDLILVGLALFTWGFGEGMFLIFQPIYLEQLGASPVLIGIVLGSMGLAMALPQIPAGYLADRVGARPLMIISWAIGGVASLMMGLARSLPLFIVGIVLYGLTSFSVSPMNSYISSVRGNLSVEQALNLVGGMFYLGAVIGPILGGNLGAMWGLRPVYQIASVVFIFSTLITLLIRPQPVVTHIETAQIRLSKNPRFLAIVALFTLTMFAIYLPQPLSSAFLQNEHHLSLTTIGWLATIGNLGNAVVSMSLSNLDALEGLLIGQGLAGIFTLLMLYGNGFIGYGIGYFLLGGYRLSRLMSLAFIHPLVKISQIGRAYGIIETFNTISITLAPPLAGFLYAINPNLVYTTSLGLIAFLFLCNLIFLPRLRHPFSKLETISELE